MIIIDGTARHIETGEVAWEHDDPDAEPLFADAELVVLGTSDGVIGIDPRTGRQVWDSAVIGTGIAHNGEILVIADATSEEQIEAVAIELATGEERWRQEGRPAMECDLGPTDRFSPAREQSHVLLIADEERDNDAALLDLADGDTAIAEVNCSLTARVVGEVLIEAEGGEVHGRSVSNGDKLWSTIVSEPWNINGGGTMVFTPAGSGVNGIDVTTGRTDRVNPPDGTRDVWVTGEIYRAPETWLLIDQESGFALWNPSSDDRVEVPAAALGVESIDAASGWISLSGKAHDFTGEESSQCWVMSPAGQLWGPFPTYNKCYIAEGLLQTNSAVYPLS